MQDRDDDRQILFVFGSARGGTTFLSKILTDWFSFGMGPEGTFIQDIVDRAEKLGDLGQNSNRLELARHIVATETFQIIQHRWGEEHRFSVDPGEIVDLMPTADAAGAIYAAFKVMALKMGKARVGNKNPGYWREIDTLHRLFPDSAKYLFIVRDGRDVALSLRDVPWGGHSAFAAANIWRNMIATTRRFEQQLPPGRMLTIRYEDLLDKPDQTFVQIGRFVGQDDLETLSARFLAAAGQNSLKSNFGKWRSGMSEADQRVYEAVAGAELEHFDYDRRYPGAGLSRARTLSYEAAEFLRKVRTNLYHHMRRLPLDARQSRSTSMSRLVQPGSRDKSR